MNFSHLGYASSAQGHLTLQGLDLTSLVHDSPVYVLNETLIRLNIRAYVESLQEHYPKPSTVFYASKAFLNLSMARLVSQEGIGLDVCSEGELFIAAQAHFPKNRILFHGNNKSDTELRQAIQQAIYVIVVDNASEFTRIEKIVGEEEAKPGVLLRVNPQIKVDTHPSLATGVKGSKFGLCLMDPQTLDLLRRMAKSSFVKFQGLHCHIGSQVTDLQAYTDALEELVGFMGVLKGEGIPVSVLNIGGGLGVNPSTPSNVLIHQWVAHVCGTVKNLCEHQKITLPDLMIEPGRSIVSEAGCTLYRIGSIKETPDITIVAVQGGMSDNIRPALLKADYPAVLANKVARPLREKPYKIVGSCCESGDILIPKIQLPICEEGDVLAILHTGAYSYSLANQYNKHPLPGMIFVREGGYYDYVTKPQPLHQLLQNDSIPGHLEE